MKKIILACLLIPFMFSSVNAEEKIGTVNKIKTYAYGVDTTLYLPPISLDDMEWKPLFARDNVYQDQIIKTVKNGAIWIIFNDDTELFMGESGSLALTEFVYNVNQESMVISLAKGLFRFITGSIQSEKVIINGPVGTIGIRGTDVEITIDDTGATTITNFEGSVAVTVAGIPIELVGFTEGCQSILIASNGRLIGVEPCPPGGPSIGPATFASGHSGGGGGGGASSSPAGDSGGPSGGDSGGPGGGGEGPGNDGPSGGSGNGNGNNGNPGNGGGNTNGSGPGTGNNGQNNGQGHGAGNGGGGNGNGGAR